MKKTRIINHLKEMKKAVESGDQELFKILLETLITRTIPQKQLFEIEGYHINVNNGNGLSINIIKDGKYIKYIPNQEYITSKGIITKEKTLQDVIESEFYDEITLLFRDAKNEMDKNIKNNKQTNVNNKNIQENRNGTTIPHSTKIHKKTRRNVTSNK